jgi:hypothetical protein
MEQLDRSSFVEEPRTILHLQKRQPLQKDAGREHWTNDMDNRPHYYHWTKMEQIIRAHEQWRWNQRYTDAHTHTMNWTRMSYYIYLYLSRGILTLVLCYVIYQPP